MAVGSRARVRLCSSERVHADVRGARPSVWDEVYDWVRKIPRGRVMTYGQIADLMIARVSPRAVGWALHGSPKGLPWQRVVNASGGCSTDRIGDVPLGLQRALLEREGVKFHATGKLDLQRYRWNPRGRRPTRAAKQRSAAKQRPAAKHGRAAKLGVAVKSALVTRPGRRRPPSSH